MSAEQAWERLTSEYIRQVELALASVDHPRKHEVLQDIRDHLRQRFADLPPEERTLEGLAAAIQAMGPPDEYAELLVPSDEGTSAPASETPPTSLVHSGSLRGVPWQIWVTVGVLGFEGAGDLVSIANPQSAVWLAAKVLFVVGLLKRWRWVFVLFLIVAGLHVVVFNMQAPFIAVLNLGLMVLVASARRFYFPKERGEIASEQSPGPCCDSLSARRRRCLMKLGIAGIAVLVGSGLAAALALGAGERAEAARLLHLGGRLMALAAGQPAEDAVARDVPDSRRGRTRLENPGEPKAETAPAQGPATMAALPITDGFETGQAAPDGWQQGAAVPGVQYIWDKNTAFEGKASLCLKKTAQRFFPIADWSRVVRHEGTQRKLRLSAQVKAEQVTKAVIDAQFADAQGNWIKHEWAAYIGAKEAGDPPANHDWKEYVGTVDIPLGAKLVRLGLQIYGPGTVWFDALTASYVTQ